MSSRNYNADEEVVADKPLSGDELESIRRHRRNPDYTPQPSFNPLHEGWTDTEVIVLAPFFGMTEPPTIEIVDSIMKTHPALEARPERPYHAIGLETLARYCFRHEQPEWDALGIQLSKREGFQKVLEWHSKKSRT
jgi:hypothetical protein